MNVAHVAAPDFDWAGRHAADAELVAAVRAGYDDAFAELYRRYHPGVTRFVRGRVRDHGRAEDVVQETFVSALRRMRETESELAFRPWVFEIARNASIDLYRRSSRADEISIDADGGLAQADASRLGGTAGPDASLVRKQSFEHFRSALDELSATHHRIIVMRELEGRSYREIGERMELSQAAVESTLFRARRKLEHEYEQLDSGRRCRLVAAAIGRLAEGMESGRDRARLDRHARRCSACRRQARQLGVEPLLGRRLGGLPARAAALLPLPGFLRRRSSPPGGEDAAGAGSSGIGHGANHVGAMLAPSVDAAGGLAGKAAAVITAVVLVGGGGATLGGVGPLAIQGPDMPTGAAEPRSADRVDRPARPRTARPGARDLRAGPAAGSPLSTLRAKQNSQGGRGRAGHSPVPPTRAETGAPAGQLPAPAPVEGPSAGAPEAEAPQVTVPAPEASLPPALPAAPAPPPVGATMPAAAPVVTADPVAVAGSSLSIATGS